MQPGLIQGFRAREEEMLGALGRLVRAESPSKEAAAVAACAAVLGEIATDHLGPPELVAVAGTTHLHWAFGEPRILLLGHFDTVWPLGTIDRWDFHVQDGRATGPGIFDMKAGLIQALFALSSLEDLEGIEVLFTGDEEIGSPTSRPVIEDAGRRARAVLVVEPSADGALKVARKGTGVFHVHARGRAAHAGLEPEAGINAVLELCNQALAIAKLARPEAGTTVTPTVISGGGATNTVPRDAELIVDVRITSEVEQRRIEEAMRDLQPNIAGAELSVAGNIDRPPLQKSASTDLFERAQLIAMELGLGTLEGAEVGGGSDGNFTAAVGTPTLDGLGPVGGGAHAEGEWIDVSAMAERTSLVARLVEELRR